MRVNTGVNTVVILDVGVKLCTMVVSGMLLGVNVSKTVVNMGVNVGGAIRLCGT